MSMSEAMKLIVGGFVRLGNREALEKMRDHRQRLLQESRMRRNDAFNPESLHVILQAEIAIIDRGLGGLNAS